ncbi:protein CMSS1 isoform X2 [Clinocottus analis]|uniref:protein CMSS1 isoform X2 n=1 Tax=Clinocottus analis TaxID=304258 RepID=UPI0035C1238D
MGDDLGDEWWAHEENSAASEAEDETQREKPPTDRTKKKTKAEKRKSLTEETVQPKKKKTQQKECIIPQKKDTEDDNQTKPKRRRKKTITDVLSSSEPKPGSPADLQALVTHHLSGKLSVIEQEELRLQDGGFLSSNDLTHSLSSYLKHVCPKWSKVQKQHAEKSSVVLLVVCSSALRTIELIKQTTAFKGEARAVKLFAKHIKMEEQVKLLQKGVTHIGVGTPGRIGALVEKEGLSLKALRYVVLDWNWRDQKQRRMVDVPEVKLELLRLLENGILSACKEEKVKIGLF